MNELIAVAGFWVSIFMAVVAVLAVSVSYIVYRASNAPNVIVYANDDRRRPTLIELVIENIGHGPAKNVIFFPARDLPKNAWGFDDAKMPQKMDEGLIVTGISYLAPGARRVINWGQYGGLKRWFEDSTVDIKVCFERCDAIPFGKRRMTTLSTVEVSSFASTDASDSNWDKKIAKELEELNTHMQKLVALISDLSNRGQS